MSETITLQGMPDTKPQVAVGDVPPAAQRSENPGQAPPRISDLDPLDDGGDDAASDQQAVDAAPVDDPVERRKVITRIAAYARSRLSKYMPPLPSMAEIEMMSVAQLNDILREVQYAVNIGQNANNVEKIAHIGVGALENMLCAFTPLKLRGFADNCMADDSFLDNITELSLLYQDYAYVSPEKRLLLTMAKCALVTHQVNSVVQVSGNVSKMREAVTADIERKYSDL